MSAAKLILGAAELIDGMDPRPRSMGLELRMLAQRLEGLREEAESLRKLQSVATQGPWTFNAMGDWSVITEPDRAGMFNVVVSGDNRGGDYVDPEDTPIGRCEDGDLIAAARNTTLPADLLEILSTVDTSGVNVDTLPLT